MNDYLLTIAIPTYNGKQTIKKTLDILLPQINDSVELIISDNCSNKESTDTIKEYTDKYPFIKYSRNAVNIGADGNFLKCMKIANGKYVYLLSDDDILVEGALKKILNFLDSNKKMGLVYLPTANFYVHYEGVEKCKIPNEIPFANISTLDKKEFFYWSKHYWGFVSSFIILKENFDKIQNPEMWFGTYWLQSYIHIMCAVGDETLLGVVNGICVGAGVYLTQSNFDISYVDGVQYKKMIDFAIKNGFCERQLNNWYVDRICLLASHGIIKEKASNNVHIDKKMLFNCTKHYLKAWVCIYPFFFVPSIICKVIVGIKRSMHGASFKISTNRAGDVKTQMCGEDVK